MDKQTQFLILVVAIIGLLLVTGIAAISKAAEADQISIIPKPMEIRPARGQFTLRYKTAIYAEDGSAEVKAVANYLAEQLRPATGFSLVVLGDCGIAPTTDSILLTTKDADKDLGEEGYELVVSKDNLVLRALHPAGLFYGVQTIRQLLAVQIESKEKIADVCWTIPCVVIRDKPRFGWRGSLLDCSRQFMSKDFVKRYINLLAYHKMNRFHWHLTDDPGWRIEIKKYPKLTETGAWRNTGPGHLRPPEDPPKTDEIYGGYYTQEDIKDIVAYAKSRYVTIVPEIEMPGHSSAALASYPELSCTGGPFKVKNTMGIFLDVYCPGNERTFEFLEDVLSEVVELFPSLYIHIGGDECPKDRWKQCPKCQARIKTEGLKDEDELQSYFIKRIEKILLAKGRRLIGWDEILEGGLAPQATVQSWRGMEGAIAAATSGHDTIISPTTHCYFDYPYSEKEAVLFPKWMAVLPTEKVYSFEPVPEKLTAEQQRHILGGEGNIWTEFAPQEEVDSRAYPRLTALAEVLWSPKEGRSWEDFEKRLKIHYKRLDILGVKYHLAGDGGSLVGRLYKGHPRLILKDEDLEGLKQKYPEDENLKRCVREILNSADNYLEKPLLRYEKIGPRLLQVSRECLHRIYTLGIAYRWTGEEKYAKRASEELLAVCSFDDWNPSHFLDTAEMSHAVGIGYDWLYHYLDGQSRKKIKEALITNGLKSGIDSYQQRAWWTDCSFNWNQVCNSGLIIGAIAIAEAEPQYLEQIGASAIANLPVALKEYGPDGGWPEGVSYWLYATQYTAYGLSAMRSAFGTDFGLSVANGLSETGYFPIYLAGPTGLFFNFADSGEYQAAKSVPVLFWLGRMYENYIFSDFAHALLAKYGSTYEHLIWYRPNTNKGLLSLDLDHRFDGSVPVAVFRSSWDDPNAMFVAVKGGYNQVNHGHLDLGNFEMDALGVRWARDLGRDDYNLEGYWDKKKGGRRWTYYRNSSASHSVPLINGQSQNVLAEAKFTKFKSEKSAAFVIIDLTSAYSDFANKTMRGVAVINNRRAALIQDEFEIEKPCEISWAMTTDADIDVANKTAVTLTLKGRQMVGRILSPEGVYFSSESAEQEPPQARNKGVKRLIIKVPDAKGNVRIAVLFSPVWAEGDVKTAEIKPLSEW